MNISLLINHPSNEHLIPVSDDSCEISIKRNLQNNLHESKRVKLDDEELANSETDSSSVASSRRSTATSLSSTTSASASPTTYNDQKEHFTDIASDVILNSTNSNIQSAEELINIIANNRSYSIHIDKVSFKDTTIPIYGSNKDVSPEEDAQIRQDILNKIQRRYVDPLLSLTGYKWVRKEVPSKGKGLKIFSVKYLCSQQKVDLKKNSDRSRQLTHPLKQFNCKSSYLIKYIWSKQMIQISYNHLTHTPYKRLPDKLKPFILERLDKKALDLYNDIMQDPQFNDVKHLIFFSKVQSYWSKERTKRKEKSTKDAFKNFFESKS